MTQVQTGTTDRKSWKAEAEKEKARGDFYKKLLCDALDSIKSVEDLINTKREIAKGAYTIKGESEKARAYLEDAHYVGWILEALTQDIEQVDADHNVGDCKKKFDELVEITQQKNQPTDWIKLDSCLMCDNNFKHSRQVLLAKDARGLAAGLNEQAAKRNAARELEAIKKLIK